jgi:photosystem II stability/assembly factor-like uncharacterized protein
MAAFLSEVQRSRRGELKDLQLPFPLLQASVGIVQMSLCDTILRAMHLNLFVIAVVGAAVVPVQASPQPPQVWQMQDSGTTAGLRGIDSVDGTVAWASGTGGTVLKTIDGGQNWLQCAIPDAGKDGASLDFRGVQAWDATTAIVMASGPGEKSRLYKTTDGCKSWSLLLKNPDSAGFYNSIAFWDQKHGILVGDPVRQMQTALSASDGTIARNVQKFDSPKFLVLMTNDEGSNWDYWGAGKFGPPDPGSAGGAAFASSNSSAFLVRQISADSSGREYKAVLGWIGIGGKGGARVFTGSAFSADKTPSDMHWSSPVAVPMAGGKDSTGVFSIAFRLEQNLDQNINFTGDLYHHGVAVGGDYTQPNDPAGAAAFTSDGGHHWSSSINPPHGYRSTVQWSESLKLWITAGTNGSDISRDDGKTWRPLDNGSWNALSLPFIVGPQGRIARLNPEALPRP